MKLVDNKTLRNDYPRRQFFSNLNNNRQTQTGRTDREIT